MGAGGFKGEGGLKAVDRENSGDLDERKVFYGMEPRLATSARSGIRNAVRTGVFVTVISCPRLSP